MHTLEDLLRDDLGEDVVLEPLLKATLPDDPVGYGKGAEAPRIDLDEVAREPFAEELDTFPAANTNHNEPPSIPFHLERDLTDPRIVLVRTSEGTIRTLRGHTRAMPNGVILFGAAEQAVVRVTVSSGTYVVSAHERDVTVFEVHTSNDATWQPLEDWRPDRGDDLLRDGIDSVLDGSSCEAWLREAASSLAESEHLVDRAAALGLIGRLWAPASDGERAALKQEPDRHPNRRVLEAVEKLPQDRVRLLEQLACHGAMSLLDALHHVETSDSDDDRLRLARRLAERRDDLESVFFVLIHRDVGRELGAALADLDDEVTSAWSALPEAESLADDPRMCRVALLEPDAWWGHLGEI